MTYDGPGNKPSGGPTPGALALRSWVHDVFDVQDGSDDLTDLGIYNPRDVCGNPWPDWKCAASLHSEGRAVDFGVPVGDEEEGSALATYLVENFEAIGVQEVIWYRMRWASNTRAWQRYTGRSPHTDHVHAAITKHAAEHLTVTELNAIYNRANHPTNQHNEDEDEEMSRPKLYVVNTGKGAGTVYATEDGKMWRVTSETDRKAFEEAEFKGPFGVSAAQIEEMAQAYDMDLTDRAAAVDL